VRLLSRVPECALLLSQAMVVSSAKLINFDAAFQLASCGSGLMLAWQTSFDTSELPALADRMQQQHCLTETPQSM